MSVHDSIILHTSSSDPGSSPGPVSRRRPRLPSTTALCIALLALFLPPLAGCSSDNGETPTGSDTGSVEGMVVDPSDQGVAGAALTMSRSGEASRTASSGSNGGFAFDDLAVGTWSLSLEPPQGWSPLEDEPVERSVTVSAGGTTDVTFRLVQAGAGGSVSGTILHDGRGVGEVQLTLDGEGTESERTTDNSGAFLFEDLAPGDYELTISPPAWFRLATGEADVRTISVGSDDGETVQVLLTPETTQEVHEIRAGEQSFSPDDITVAPGARIRWINEYDIEHTVTPDDHAEWTRRVLNQAGQTFEVVLNNPGDFSYFCEPHQALGMTGAITVEP